MRERIGKLDFAPYKDLSKAIGQIVVSEYVNTVFYEVDELTETDRGEGRFGSTDLKK